jgi:hypothetical protein
MRGELTIDPTVHAVTRRRQAKNRAARWTGCEYNELAASWEIWRKGHIVGWAADGDRAQGWLDSMESRSKGGATSGGTP